LTFSTNNPNIFVLLKLLTVRNNPHTIYSHYSNSSHALPTRTAYCPLHMTHSIKSNWKLYSPAQLTSTVTFMWITKIIQR